MHSASTGPEEVAQRELYGGGRGVVSIREPAIHKAAGQHF